MIAAAPVLGERRFDLVGEPQWIVAVIFDLGHWVVPDVQWRPPSEERACPLPQLCRAARKERAPRRGRGFKGGRSETLEGSCLTFTPNTTVGAFGSIVLRTYIGLSKKQQLTLVL